MGRGSRRCAIIHIQSHEIRTREAPMTTPLPQPSDSPQQTPPAPPNATLLQVAGAVFWSFFGVRKNRDMQRDAATIKPLHVLIVGVVAGLAFVLLLIALVTFITRKT